MGNAHSAAHDAGHSGHATGHAVPFPVLVAVFAALLLLTFLTVAATWVNLGELNLWVALGIATFKAALVALYFMHLRYDHPFNGLVFVAALTFLALFLGMTMLDSFEYQQNITNW
jgi:cytochrome c oxidase subunit 4